MGSVLGLGIIALKHYRVWPFHRGPKNPVKKGEDGESKVQRRHARAWNQTEEFRLAREDFD